MSRGRGQAVYPAGSAVAALSTLTHKFHDWVLAEAAGGKRSK